MYQIYNQDCIEFMKTLPDNSIDCVVTDPPYGIIKSGDASQWDNIIPFKAMWEQLHRITKPKSAIILFGMQPFTSMLVMSNIKNYKHNWVWEKSRSGSAITAKYCPVKIHEDVLVFCKSSPNYYPIMEVGEPYSRKCDTVTENNHGVGVVGKVNVVNTGTRYPKTIRRVKQNWSKQQQIHPTQKPTELLEYLIKTYSLEGEVVLDFTMGSGSTGVACLNTGRRFIGCELDEKYFEIAKGRLENHII
jgi:site-specific DNA-methyltransferase (adenine-specific)